jgi:selenocysteine lyase/cysteine desulfurase
VAERTHDQATRLKEGLADVPGIDLVTPMSVELSSGIVCVAPEAAPEEVLGVLLAEGIVASLTPYAQSYVRFGPSIVTTPDEVDAVVEALRA